MSAPKDFAELREWLQKEVEGWSKAANRAITEDGTDPQSAQIIFAEKIAVSTAKALNRALELLEEKGPIN